jgi:hypothetical protein
MIKLRFIIECDNANCDSFVNIKCSLNEIISLESRQVEHYVGNSESGEMYSSDTEYELDIRHPTKELTKEGWVSTTIDYHDKIFCPKCVPIYYLKP